MVLSLDSHASYLCEGAKGTALESFELHKITVDILDVELDGNLDGSASVKPNDILEYTYNNGCDNDITLRVHKMVTESEPETFNMKIDYYGPDDLLTDTEVICRKKSGN